MTRNIVPRENGEGSIGTFLKKWLKGYFNELFCSSFQLGTTATAGQVLTADISGIGTWQTHEIMVRKTTDTVNSTITLANATELSFLAEANSEYWITCFIFWTTSATTVGIRLSADFTSTGHTMGGQWIVNASNGTIDGASFNRDDITVTTIASPFIGPNVAFLQCFLKTGANPGTWVVRFATETTPGTITIKTGSILQYRKTF